MEASEKNVVLKWRRHDRWRKEINFCRRKSSTPFTSIPASPLFAMKTSFSRAMKNYLVKNNYHSTTQDVR